MPLDAYGTTFLTQSSLLDVAAQLGIQPVTTEAFEAHKAEQIRLNPPSFLYPYQKPIAASLFTGFITGFASIMFGAIAGCVVDSTFAWCIPVGVTMMGSFLAVAVYGDSIKLKQPAVWRETLGMGWDTPYEIAKTAREISRRMPGSSIVTGTLMQGTVKLDPYVLVRVGNDTTDQVVVGIWDGPNILEIATRL